MEKITKYFALDYITKVGKIQINFPRAATIIYPLMVVTGVLHTLVDNPNKVALYTSWTLLTISAFFGFVFFRIRPVRYEELKDKEQIFQYGSAQLSGQVSKVEYDFLGDEKFDEAFEYLELKLKKRYYKPLRMIFHPVVITIITLAVVLNFI